LQEIWSMPLEVQQDQPGLNIGRRSVLIVDDEKTARMALTYLFQFSGYNAEAVSSAEAALERLEQGLVPMVVLVDLNLPQMSGLELIRRLREINPEVRPVLVTACDPEMTESFCRTCEIDCVQKPVRFPELLQLIEHPVAMHH
jgi:CheY-like chemotaxis protein